jgi:hypothetical protein
MDGAYDTRNHDAIAARGAHAVIPPRKNAKPWKPTSHGVIVRNEAVNASRYLGQSLMARDFDRQVAEIQVRIAVLNRYTALGIPVTKAVG